MPEISPQTIAFKVKTKAERSIRQGHPWVFDQSITMQKKDGKAGDIAIIYDQKKNNFLAIGLYDPHSPIRIKILQSKQPARLNAEWFRQTIENAFAIRQPLLQTQTNSYRLIYGENDSLPGCICDIYAETAVLKLYSAIWFPYLSFICEAILHSTKSQNLVLRLSRNLQKMPQALHGLEDGMVLIGALDTKEVLFLEHGLQFYAHVIKGHKTGYFLDHCHNRKRVGELAKGKTVLDVFSYAGGFSVHAAAGGATSVSSLDISKQALALAQKNMALNELEARHEIIAGDAFKEMAQLISARKQFDIVIIDPPSFAKRESEIASAEQSYRRLFRLGADLIAVNGTLVLASCSSRITADRFSEMVEDELRKSGKHFIEESRTFHDIDHPVTFPEGAYLKCMFFRRK